MKNKKLKTLGLSFLLVGGIVLSNGNNVEASRNFNDVPVSSSHAESINYLNNLDVFDYKSDNLFKQNESITRSEAAKVLYNLFNSKLDKVRTYNNNFTDVSNKSAYYKEIIWSYEVGIFDGDGNNKFKANSNLTRAQMSKILVNSFGLKSKGTYTLKDVKMDSWVFNYVSILYGNGITTGDGKGNFLPNDNVTNGQFSSFVYRTLKVIEGGKGEEVKPVDKHDNSSSNVIASFNSEYDFKWNMTGNNEKLTLEGVKQGKVVAKYETIINKGLNEIPGVKIGSSHKKEVRNLYGSSIKNILKGNVQYNLSPSEEYDIYLIKDNYVTVFYDIHKNNIVRSILVIDKNSELNKDGFYGNTSNLLNSQDGNERLMIELINQSRVSEGLSSLKESQSYREVGRLHSADMAKNNYFSHYGKDGSTPYDRMLKGGFKEDNLYWWGENLAYGQYNTIYAHEALMNSKGHRANILNENFTNAFVGMSYKDTVPYWTVGFFSLWK